MTQEQIQMQADKYADKYAKEYGLNDATTFGMSLGFKAGANWRIKSVWHKPEEKPNNVPILAISENRLPIIAGPNCSEWEDVVNEFKLTEWAYIDDFLPQEE